MASTFSNARIEKLIQSSGVEHISDEAVEKMNEILSDWARNIAKYAVEIAKHSGRKTVKENDIKLAAQRRT